MVTNFGESAAPRPAIDAVVVGASAGAVEVLNVILPALPASFRAAVIVVVHVPAQGPSLLVDLYASRCALAVREPLDKEPVLANTIWFAPPDYHLLIERDRTFSLSIDEAVNFSRPSIDVLFESAADVFGDRVIGLVLSGASRDGCSGARAIQRAGGLLAIQDPASAAAPLLPTLTLGSTTPDKLGSPLELAQFLVECVGGTAC